VPCFPSPKAIRSLSVVPAPTAVSVVLAN
jgi:hypothetical protein